MRTINETGIAEEQMAMSDVHLSESNAVDALRSVLHETGNHSRGDQQSTRSGESVEHTRFRSGIEFIDESNESDGFGE